MIIALCSKLVCVRAREKTTQRSNDNSHLQRPAVELHQQGHLFGGFTFVTGSLAPLSPSIVFAVGRPHQAFLKGALTVYI